MKTLINIIFKVQENSRQTDAAILLIRIAVAFYMFTHGFPKMDRLGMEEVKFLDFMGLGPVISLSLAIFAEVICSGFILFGFGTRLAVIPLIITMLVITLHVHWGDPFAKMELAFHYLTTYIVLFITGSGRYSFDYYFFAKK